MNPIPKSYYFVLPSEQAFITLRLLSGRLARYGIEHRYGRDQLTGREEICFRSATVRDKAIALIEVWKQESDRIASTAQTRREVML